MDPLRSRLRLFLFFMFGVMILATGGFMITEGLPLALYFSIVTVATVGYGDIQRSYRLVGYQWLDYMKHLRDTYPTSFHLQSE